MNKIAIVVNTVSKNSDLWEMFFKQLQLYSPSDIPIHVFVDPTDDEFPIDGLHIHHYDPKKLYKEQFVSCISEVEEEFCIYISEDYILYDEPMWDKVFEYRDFLQDNPHLSFIRFNKGGVVEIELPKYKGKLDLFQMSNVFPYFYTNQAAVWRTRDLDRIHVAGPNMHIAGTDFSQMFEPHATKTCQELNIQGLHCYHGEPKRGRHHYDTNVFPHVATALVKGKWNMSEYPNELGPLIEEYKIDVSERGTR